MPSNCILSKNSKRRIKNIFASFSMQILYTYLRCHIVYCAASVVEPGAAGRRIQLRRHPEVNDLELDDVAAGGGGDGLLGHDVLGLEIQVDDSQGVDVSDAADDLKFESLILIRNG